MYHHGKPETKQQKTTTNLPQTKRLKAEIFMDIYVYIFMYYLYVNAHVSRCLILHNYQMPFIQLKI